MADEPESTKDENRSSENKAGTEKNGLPMVFVLKTKDDPEITDPDAYKTKQSTQPIKPSTSVPRRMVNLFLRKADEASLADWAMVLFTLIIAASTIVYTVYARRQWREMNGSGRQTDQIIEAANKIETHLKQTVLDNKQALADNKMAIENALKENRLEFSGALEQNRKSLEASTSQSNKALNASIDISRLDQRPWVLFPTFTLSSEPEDGKEITVKITLENTGKSPALTVANQGILLMSSIEPSMTEFSSVNVIDGSSRTVVPPGSGPTEITFTTTPWIVPKATIDAYKNKTWKLYIHAKASYSDAFGKQHWTTACSYHQSGWGMSQWRFCSQGNDVDHEEQEKKQNPN